MEFYKKIVNATMLFFSVLLIYTNAFGKVVVIEMFNDPDAGWSHCVKAAGTLNTIKKEYKDSVATAWYHTYEPFNFTIPEGINRSNYYNFPYTPQCYVDGILNTMDDYATVKNYVEQRKKNIAPVIISIASSCPALSGNATVTIKNVSNASVSGTLQFVLKQRGIKYSWAYSFVENAVRKMVPNENGEAITLAAGESVTKSRAFNLNSAWIKDSCRLVAFVQKSNKEIIAGSVCGVNQGTIITPTTAGAKKSIEYRITPESFMLYMPGTGSSLVALFDVHGREVAHFCLNARNCWHKLPRKMVKGITIVKVQNSGAVHIGKAWVIR